MTRTSIIGDVHGCSKELDELLLMLQFASGATMADRLIFVGDLVDKGPDSAGVVRHVRLLREKGYDVTLVDGNHEEGLRRWLKKDAAGRAKVKRTAMYETYDDKLDSEDLDLLASAVPYIKLPEYGVLVTHAGVPFELTELPDDARETASWSRKQRKYVDRMCRIRYVDADWKFVSLYDVEPHHTYWAEGYDGRFGTVVYGHEPYLKPSPVVHVPEGGLGPYNIGTSFRRGIGRPTQRAIGIDLGCVFGGHLCALVLDGEERSIVTVQAHGKYAEPLYASTNLFTED
jgi:aryl carrier-like protein